jgi:Na+-translocating ferredoxin:NAD+ oxidoreductase subunit B
MKSDLLDRIHQALPQTQCTRCGYADCLAYAQAIAQGQAGINQCPPGGAEGVERLAKITGQSSLPLNPDHGTEGHRLVMWIDEAWCIGCTLCVAPCPTDAIVGSNKQMHSIIEADCTGCGLCLPACPVDCIQTSPTGSEMGWAAWSPQQATRALNRYEQKQTRQSQKISSPNSAASAAATSTEPSGTGSKQDRLNAILSRAKLQKPAS